MAQSFLAREKFFASGEWEGTYLFVDITTYRGSWKIEPAKGGGAHVVLTMNEVDGEKLEEPSNACQNILPNAHDNTALLWNCADPAAVNEVRFSDLDDRDNRSR